MAANTESFNRVMSAVFQQKEAEKTEEAKKSKRVHARTEAWAAEEFTEEQRNLIVEAADLIGQATRKVDEPLSPEQIDNLVEEVVALRKAQDIINGRHEALRGVAFAAMDLLPEVATEDEPSYTPAELYSEKHETRLLRRIKGGNAYAEWSQLEGVVSQEVWESVTDRVVTTRKVYVPGKARAVVSETDERREVNEDRLIQAVVEGKITPEQLGAVTKFTKKVPSFHVK